MELEPLNHAFKFIYSWFLFGLCKQLKKNNTCFKKSIQTRILGIVILLVEWRQRHIRSLFYFLTYKTGRGFFYIFVGCLTTGVAKTAGIIGKFYKYLFS